MAHRRVKKIDARTICLAKTVILAPRARGAVLTKTGGQIVCSGQIRVRLFFLVERNPAVQVVRRDRTANVKELEEDGKVPAFISV